MFLLALLVSVTLFSAFDSSCILKFAHILPCVCIFSFFICYQIEINELDDFAQAAFRGFKYLNRIQSRIFDTVYNTNENILVSYFLSICGKLKS